MMKRTKKKDSMRKKMMARIQCADIPVGSRAFEVALSCGTDTNKYTPARQIRLCIEKHY